MSVIERCIDLLKPGGRMGIVLPEGVFNNPSLSYVREYVENRAFIRAVMSLPQETFYSSGASVKASLLFLQRFTDAEKADFERTNGEANAEVEAKYASEVAEQIASFKAAIEATKKDKVKKAELTKAMKVYQREMAVKIKREARALLKERFDYPIFLYEAEKVGITATGEADENELYPNPRVPEGIEKTCVELYRTFFEKPGAFLMNGAG